MAAFEVSSFAQPRAAELIVKRVVPFDCNRVRQTATEYLNKHGIQLTVDQAQNEAKLRGRGLRDITGAPINTRVSTLKKYAFVSGYMENPDDVFFVWGLVSQLQLSGTLGFQQVQTGCELTLHHVYKARITVFLGPVPVYGKLRELTSKGELERDYLTGIDELARQK